MCTTTELSNPPAVPNYNICTQCKATVCNQCGFNPNPHLTEVSHAYLCPVLAIQRMKSNPGSVSQSRLRNNSKCFNPKIRKISVSNREVAQICIDPNNNVLPRRLPPFSTLHFFLKMCLNSLYECNNISSSIGVKNAALLYPVAMATPRVGHPLMLSFHSCGARAYLLAKTLRVD